MNSTKSYGFTLIELVMALVIVGVVAATAFPKFISLQAESRYRALQATMGAAKDTAELIHAKAIIANQTGSTGQVTLSNGTVIDLVYGYPAANSSGIIRAMKLSIAADSYTKSNGTNVAEFMIVNESYAENRCYCVYEEPNSVTLTPSYRILADIDPLASKGAAGVEQCN